MIYIVFPGGCPWQTGARLPLIQQASFAVAVHGAACQPLGVIVKFLNFIIKAKQELECSQFAAGIFSPYMRLKFVYGTERQSFPTTAQFHSLWDSPLLIYATEWSFFLLQEGWNKHCPCSFARTWLFYGSETFGKNSTSAVPHIPLLSACGPVSQAQLRNINSTEI